MLFKQAATALLGLASVHALTMDRRANPFVDSPEVSSGSQSSQSSGSQGSLGSQGSQGYEGYDEGSQGSQGSLGSQGSQEGLDNAEGGLCRFEIVTEHMAPGDVLGRSSAPYYRSIGAGSDATQTVTPDTIACLLGRGISHVISLNSQAHAEDIRQNLENAGIAYTAIPVEDYHNPTQADFATGWEAFLQHRNGTLVWCGYGHGRTGTMISALQMHVQHERSQLRHWTSADYAANHVEEPVQEQALDELEKSLRSQGPQGVTPTPSESMDVEDRPQGVTPNPPSVPMEVDDQPQEVTPNPSEAMDVDNQPQLERPSTSEPVDVDDQPQGVTPNPPEAMDVDDQPQGVTPNPPEAMDIDAGNSAEPMDVDQAILERWRQGVFGTVDCLRAILALTSLTNNKYGRSVSKLSLRAGSQEDCRRAREMALNTPDQSSTPGQSSAPCSKVSKLQVGFQLADNNYAGTYDDISVAFASEKDEKTKTNQPLRIASAPSAGLHVWKDVDLNKFFGASSVALRDISYVGLYDYSVGLGISGDRWEFQGLKLRGQCLGTSKQVEVGKFASVNTYLQHSTKNKGNPWIFQMPFFPKVDDGHRGTAELVWAGNITVSDWKAMGGVQGEKPTADEAAPEFCYAEGGPVECSEGSGKDKYQQDARRSLAA